MRTKTEQLLSVKHDAFNAMKTASAMGQEAIVGVPGRALVFMIDEIIAARELREQLRFDNKDLDGTMKIREAIKGYDKATRLEMEIMSKDRVIIVQSAPTLVR